GGLRVREVQGLARLRCEVALGLVGAARSQPKRVEVGGGGDATRSDHVRIGGEVAPAQEAAGQLLRRRLQRKDEADRQIAIRGLLGNGLDHPARLDAANGAFVEADVGAELRDGRRRRTRRRRDGNESTRECHALEQFRSAANTSKASTWKN